MKNISRDFEKIQQNVRFVHKYWGLNIFREAIVNNRAV